MNMHRRVYLIDNTIYKIDVGQAAYKPPVRKGIPQGTIERTSESMSVSVLEGKSVTIARVIL